MKRLVEDLVHEHCVILSALHDLVIADKVERGLRFFDGFVKRHRDKEEKIFFPWLLCHHPEMATLVEHLITEHAVERALVDELRITKDPKVVTRKIAKLTVGHILEENRLFLSLKRTR